MYKYANSDYARDMQKQICSETGLNNEVTSLLMAHTHIYIIEYIYTYQLDVFINKLICVIMNWAHLAEASWISHASGCRRSRLEVWPTEERPGFNQESGPFVMFFITKSDATESEELLKSCWKYLVYFT